MREMRETTKMGQNEEYSENIEGTQKGAQKEFSGNIAGT